MHEVSRKRKELDKEEVKDIQCITCKGASIGKSWKHPGSFK